MIGWGGKSRGARVGKRIGRRVGVGVWRRIGVGIEGVYKSKRVEKVAYITF